MAKRIVTKIGDVFEVKLDDKTKKYFQYVANDLTQLNSSVIRAFKRAYSLDEYPELFEVVKDEVDFYAHCVLRWGIQSGLWEKVKNVPFNGQINVSFRDSDDVGEMIDGELIKVSKKWRIWRINEPFIYIGRLEGENRKAEIGVVVTAGDVIIRMKTGAYKFVYSGFE